jgi:predicted metal-dependent phosphoesterase TrpH
VDASDLSHAAALMAAAFVTRKDAETPEDAARIYFHCLDALISTAKEHDAERLEVARKERQPKPWERSKQPSD